MNNLSLKWKILLSVTLTCIAAVIATTLVTVRTGIATTESAIIEDTRTLAQVLGEASVGAMTFDDSATVNASLGALRVSPRVLSAVVYSAQKPFAWYEKNTDSKIVPRELSGTPRATGIEVEGELLLITETIKSDGATIGAISLRVDMSEVDVIVTDAIYSALGLVFIISLIAASLAYAVQLSIVRPVNNVVTALRDIAEGEGDLTRRLPVTGNDEVSELARCFNQFVERLQSIIASVAHTARDVSDSAVSLSQLSRENEREIRTQQTEIQHIVGAVKEMAGVVQDVTVSVTETADKSLQADDAAEEGKTLVVNTMGQITNLSGDIKTAADVIDRLRQETVSIGSVLDVIRGIAEQTNLLALNAAIEAARAGEQGRGFAVVADEVRTLASKTQSSTTEIREMIERLQSGSQKAVEMMAAGTNQAGNAVVQASDASHALENITEIVSVIRDRTNQIAAASEQQSAATRQIENNIDRISSVATHTAESSSRITTNTGNLAEMAARMAELVGRFRV
ncbi:methyl-accepting chemotaxis protein [Cellvibrio fibrivorans]|uniref:Methyl-accepting chemotaxis protein n=1 Tax=Cellvibrio fibrivorans TaxID=126350 RepID=A0ABU1UYS3_9GAMM|nr:methyl-accepting chemotaxis protein [Cellvibrio fibrivorans]MDR7090356.1 methyl-accepting chemotaxis protein [Cellvibrio fibrivorans]